MIEMGTLGRSASGEWVSDVDELVESGDELNEETFGGDLPSGADLELTDLAQQTAALLPAPSEEAALESALVHLLDEDEAALPVRSFHCLPLSLPSSRPGLRLQGKSAPEPSQLPPPGSFFDSPFLQVPKRHWKFGEKEKHMN